MNKNRADERMRLFLVALGTFALFSLLIIQFYRIQIVEGDKWTKEARKQHYFFVKEPFLRGSFYSNTSIKKGHPEKSQKLVFDVQKFHLYIDPMSIDEEHRDTIAAELIQILNLPDGKQAAFRAHFDRASRSRKLAMWLDSSIYEAINDWWMPYAQKNHIPRNAVYFLSDYQRSYPFGKLLGQVLHTVQSNRDEETKQSIPTGGLELYFQRYLEGKLGKRRLMRSPGHALAMGEVIDPPENGADVYLTINHYLQAVAEEEVEKGVKRAKAKAGWAVMMNPHSGEIFALAQYPDFHPPDYRSYFNNPALTEHARVKVITNASELGSIMKPVTLAVALLANQELERRGELKLFDPDNEKIAVSDGCFPGRRRPIRDVGRGHKFLNMDMALQKSSNIYMGRVIDRVIKSLGKEWYRNTLIEVFGFAKKTGIELPAESCGVLPKPGRKHPNGTLEWSVPTPYSLAMGYNLQMTSMQMVRAFAVLANRGKFVQPTLVRKIVRKGRGGEEQVLFERNEQNAPQVIPVEIAERIVQSLKYSTQHGGTCWRAEVPGYTEAGKSGTAMQIVNGEYTNKKHIGSFIGFAPAKNPAFVLLVSIEEPEVGYEPGRGSKHHGGACATPVFRAIASRTLEYLGITPDDPYGYPVGDPRRDQSKADWSQEVQRLKELYEAWNQ